MEQIVSGPLLPVPTLSPPRRMSAMFSFRLPLPFFEERTPDNRLQLEPVREERMGPAEFLEVLESNPDNIKSSSFVAPRLGENHFGYFEVEYRFPVYK